MSFPFVARTDWRRWFEKACPKCKQLLLEFVVRECGDDLKEKLLRGVQVTINMPGLDPIWDQLCERDRDLLKKYTKLELPDRLKEQLLRGEQAGKPTRRRKS